MKLKLDLGKTYEPKEIESAVYSWWEEHNLFNPDTQTKLGLTTNKTETFCLTLPPPNVTGSLHLGHALTIALEDLMVRYERMKGKQTLFLPGSDHAGIATQNVVERELKKQGINRKELGREKFIAKTWEWKEKYHARITEQSKRLGMSSDWSRERFTLDANLSKAVRFAFVQLFNKGLIYKGSYLVNWCPGRCESAISDLEAELEEIKSKLWYIRYPIKNKTFNKPQGEWGSGNWAKGATEFIEVATTRPETLLGDTAVATHSKHKLFGKLIGESAFVPINGRTIAIIEDIHVDPEFGTGAVKVTPAHDPNDYEIGERHNLEFITVMTESGKMIPEYSGKYANLDRMDARKQIVQDLQKEGLLIKIEDYTHSIAHCQRCHTIIEPRISKQWFVKTKPMAEKAIEQVKSKNTVILPEREEKRFYQWMENIKDWCISRQLWWGHRIPVWYCENDHQTTGLEDPTACSSCGSTTIHQDEDVLDTWFSSGLWPFSTLGWPDTNSSDFKRYYQTNMRETGYDILFFWVARELMLGIELTEKTPYKTVYFHGIVRNDQGKKISKSMENIDQYDPLNIIAEQGADSLRYTLLSNAVPGLDINLDPRQLEAAHKFCNKIWQSTKFVLMQTESDQEIPKLNINDFNNYHVTDKWILTRLHKLIRDVTTNMEGYEYLKAARDIKTFFWNEFCDWYIEASKTRVYSSNETEKIQTKIILLYVLENSFKLLHPFIPYITETLWQALPDSIKSGQALILAKFPSYNSKIVDEESEKSVSLTFELITEIRKVRSDLNVPLGKKISLIIDAGDKKDVLQLTKTEIISLAKVDQDKIIFSTESPENDAARVMIQGITAYIPLADLIDKEKELSKINKQILNLNKEMNSLKQKLAGPFSTKASPEIIEKEQARLVEMEEKLHQMQIQLEKLH
jgi:valyl-tRNA synthetase